MELHREGNVAILRMRAGKANAIGTDFLQRLGGALDGLGDAGALVITGYESFFSAGLDLPQLLSLSRAELEAFIGQFGASMLRVFELPLPVVAAVNGHAIAGGCVLALQADVRIAADAGLRIGLNEAQLGIGLPPVVVETLRVQVAAGALLPIAQEGRLFEPAEALRLGLVHQLAPKAELEATAIARAASLAELPKASYGHIKASLRRPAIEAIRADGGRSLASWVATWFSEGGRERIVAAVEKLGKKK